MELVSMEYLNHFRDGNKCTDDEWKIVGNFLAHGYLGSAKDAKICYENIQNNEFWYNHRYKYVFVSEKSHAQSILMCLIFFVILPASPYLIVDSMITASRIKKFASQMWEMKGILQSKMIAIPKCDSERESTIEDLFSNDINELINHIILVKYPDYEKDLIKIKQLAHDYVKIKQEGSETLELTIGKEESYYSALADIKMEVYLKTKEVLGKQTLEDKKNASVLKQKALDSQIQNMIDKKVDEILKENVSDIGISNQAQVNTTQTLKLVRK